MSRLDDLIHKLCPNGVEYQHFEDVCDVITDYTAAGSFKDIANNVKYIKSPSYAQLIRTTDLKNGFSDNSKFVYVDEHAYKYLWRVQLNEESIILPNVGNCGEVYYTTPSKFPYENNVLGPNSILVRSTSVNMRFLFYLFQSKQFQMQLSKITSTTGQTKFNKTNLRKTILPIPPLEVQQEIVRLLDDFTAKTAKLQTELNKEYEARKKQYEYLKNKMFSFDKLSAEISKLETYFPNIRNGFVGTATPYFTTEKEGVRYLKGTNIHDGVISDNDYCYITREFHEKHIKSELKNNDILMVQSGHVGECAVVDKQYIGSNCHALIIMSNNGKCSSKYVVHYFHTIKGKRQLSKITTGGTIKHILASDIKKVKIPFPTVEKQKAIVETLDKLEIYYNSIQLCLLDELESRQKQYEYYRDKLLTFKELNESEVN